MVHLFGTALYLGQISLFPMDSDPLLILLRENVEGDLDPPVEIGPPRADIVRPAEGSEVDCPSYFSPRHVASRVQL